MKTPLSITLFLVLLSAMMVHANDYPWSMIGQGAVPESPQASEFRRITMPVPELATGAANFQLPLYTFEAGDVQIPFTLKYIGGNGVRADAAIFPCGYGWALLPALRVTRQILGRPDEKYKFVGDTLDGCFDDHDFNFMCKSILNTDNNRRPNPERYDPERDIFTLHLPGKTINMVLNKDRFVSPGNSEYRIEYDKSTNLKWIKVWDQYGNIYMFDVIGESVMSNLLCCEWLLSSIALTDGRKIEFEWVNGGNTSDGVYSATPQNVIIGRQKCGQIIAPFSDLTTAGQYKGFCNHKTVSSVKLGKQKLTFEYQKHSGDLFLFGVKVDYDNDNVVTMDFSYRDRLLVSVFDSRSGTYGFEYNWLGIHDSFRKDPWGYSTSSDIRESNHPCVPSVRFRKMELFSAYYPKEYYDFKGITKVVDDTLCKRNILKRVTYPTGASVEWEYEPHRFAPVAFTDSILAERIVPYILTKGGGVRVCRMIMRQSADDPEPIERIYEYGTDGNGLAICEAAPTLDTFIDMALTVYLTDDTKEIPYSPFKELRFFINPNSNYLSYGWGTVPLWYDCVKEVCRDGEIEHRFEAIVSKNDIDRVDGLMLPQNINRLFASAIKETQRKTYGYEGGQKRLILTETFGWQSIQDTSEGHMYGACINRAICQDLPNTVGTDISPDFSPNETRMIYRIYIPELDINPYQSFYYNIELTKTYKSSQYEIKPFYDRLMSKRTVRHLEGGDYVRTESYEYLTGTSLLTNTTVRIGDAVSVIGTEYPSSDGSMEERGMTAMNQRALPLRRWQRAGTSSDTLICRYERGTGSSYYRPVEMYSRRAGGNLIRLCKYGYTSNHSWRNRITLPDGMEEVTIYDDSGLPLPRYILRGNSTVNPDLSGIHSASTAGKELDRESGSFELYTFRHRPLVGMTSVASPNNVTIEYGYDSSGRLSYATQKGLGAGQQYKYVVNDDSGHTYIRTATRYAAQTSDEHISVQNYDSYFRPTVCVSGSRDSRVATLTECDENGSVVRKWMPVPTDNWHVTRDEYVSTDFYQDSHPYDSIYYSPMLSDEVVSTTKAGSAWHKGGKKSMTRKYMDSGKSYTADKTGLSCLLVLSKSFLVTETTDEDGRLTRAYTDGYGRTVCTRIGTGKNTLDTYYVYNGYGDLIAILPPELSDCNRVRFDDKRFKEYGYRYEYDRDGRCIRKHMPGREPIDYRYDPMSRCVAERDGNMHDLGLWKLRHYDHMGREAVVTMSDASDSEIDNWASEIRYVIRTSDAEMCSYLFDNGELVELREPYIISYYDDYSWVADSLRQFIQGSYSRFTRSLPTGSVMSCGEDDPITTVMLYNDHGQLWQTLQTTSLGVLQATVNYRVNGIQTSLPQNVTEELVGTGIQLTTDIVYDSGWREVSRRVRYGDSEAVLSTLYNDIGRVEKRGFGSKAASFNYGYDIHGWPAIHMTACPVIDDKPSTPSSPIIFGYGSGKFPQYSGNISSIYTNGSFEYYEYDEYKRLISTHKTGSTSGFEQSNAYTYNKHSAITSITRHGITDFVDGESVYGLSDSVVYHYQGNQLKTYEDMMNNTSVYNGMLGPIELVPFGKITSYSYDSNGNLISDPHAGYSYTYNELNLLSGASSELTKNSEYYMGNSVKYSYDASGRKHRADYEASVQSFSIGSPGLYLHIPILTRRYIGSFEFEGDSLVRIRFDGGFFDGTGKPWYFEHDYQGNITGVIDEEGRYMVRHRYHPYGAPYRVNELERMQYGGKEYETFAGINISDFGSRHYNSTNGFWLQPDPKQENYAHISPYVYCAGNPIMNIDPNGEDIIVLLVDKTIGHMAMLIEDVSDGEKGPDKSYGRWLYYSINGVEVHNKIDALGMPYNEANINGGWNSPEDFFDSPFYTFEGNVREVGYDYDKGLLISTTKEQDAIMREEFSRIANEEEYNVFSNNCASTVLRVMHKAGLKTGTRLPSYQEKQEQQEQPDVLRPITYKKPFDFMGFRFNVPRPYVFLPQSVYSTLVKLYPNAIEIKSPNHL